MLGLIIYCHEDGHIERVYTEERLKEIRGER